MKELEKYGIKGIIVGNTIIISKRRPTFTVELTLTESNLKNTLLIISAHVTIKHNNTIFEYTLYNGNENVYLKYEKGEIIGKAKGITQYMYLYLDTAKEYLSSSKALYSLIRAQSSFEYLLPEDYLR